MKEDFLIWFIPTSIWLFGIVMFAMVVIGTNQGYERGYEEGLKVSKESEYGAGVNVIVDVNYTPTNAQEADTEPLMVKTKEYLGRYKLTAYCPCEKCCGTNTGKTATGTMATQGRTIGVNPKDIPYGTVVEIDGREYIAEDTGGAIGNNHIDIFFDNHADALDFGVQYADVYKVVE
jgi:3D (Asp-Asp-Asp) domain-containing protein